MTRKPDIPLVQTTTAGCPLEQHYSTETLCLHNVAQECHTKLEGFDATHTGLMLCLEQWYSSGAL